MDAANNFHVRTSTAGPAYQAKTGFPTHLSTKSWLATQPLSQIQANFDQNGFVKVCW